MLWMKCHHVFSWSTSRAPVQAHYLLSDSILHYKNVTSKQCKACGIFEHCFTCRRKRYRSGEKKGKKRLWIKTISQFLIVCVGSDWSSHQSPADGGKWIAKGNSIENDAAPQVWCNSSDAHESLSSQHSLLTSAENKLQQRPWTPHNHRQSTRRHKRTVKTPKSHSFVLRMCVCFTCLGIFSQQISASVHVKMSLWCNNPQPFTSLYNPVCINC